MICGTNLLCTFFFTKTLLQSPNKLIHLHRERSKPSTGLRCEGHEGDIHQDSWSAYVVALTPCWGRISLTNGLEVRMHPAVAPGLKSIQIHLQRFTTHREQRLSHLGGCLPSAAPLALMYLDRFFFHEAEPKFIRILCSASKPPLISLGAL